MCPRLRPQAPEKFVTIYSVLKIMFQTLWKKNLFPSFYVCLCLLGFFAINNASLSVKLEDLSNSEVKLWKAYYKQDPREISDALPRFIQYHYGLDDATELVPAYMHTLS